METLESFLWGIYRGFIRGIVFEPMPDDVELMGFSVEYHLKRIPSQNRMTMSDTQGGVGGVVNTARSGIGLGVQSNLEVLTLALTRVIEDQGASAEILERMHQHAIDKEAEKKEKAEK